MVVILEKGHDTILSNVEKSPATSGVNLFVSAEERQCQ